MSTSYYLGQFWPRFMSHMASLGHNELTQYSCYMYFVFREYMKRRHSYINHLHKFETFEMIFLEQKFLSTITSIFLDIPRLTYPTIYSTYPTIYSTYPTIYSTSHKTCTQFCFPMLSGHCVLSGLTWCIYPYSSGLLHWHWDNHDCPSASEATQSRRQAIIWTNDGILLIWPLGTKFSEISIEIHTFSFNKMHLKMSVKWRPFCLGLNELTHWGWDKMDAISQTTHLNTFSWMKMLEFRLKFHWSLFLRVQLTISQYWFR